MWVLRWESIADIMKMKQLDKLQTQKEMLEPWWKEICLKFSFISFHHKYKPTDTVSCGVSKYYLLAKYLISFLYIYAEIS